MKKIVFTSALLLIIIAEVYCQRDYQGQKSFSAFIGMGKLSSAAGLGISKNISPKLNFATDIIYESGRYKEIKYSVFNIIPQIHYSLFNLNEKLYFKLGGGILLNYSVITFGENPSGLNVGPIVSALTDFYVTDKISVFASYKTGYQFMKTMGHMPYFALVGIKYNF